MSKTYQYIVDVIARTKAFTQGMQDAVKQMKTAEKAAADMNKMTSGIGNSLKGIGAAAGIAFGVREVANFTGEIVKLSGEAEGVKAAFKRIANESDMSMLRNSVKGTVSDLELMKRAVSASNFGIPVKELGSLMEFAAKRAQDTGQSIDYLVDSIVTGIGRKSPLILDNLGISATQLKEKLGGVSMEAAGIADITRAVGEIAKDSLGVTGGLAETTATKLAKINAQWSNMKVTMGDIVANSDFLKQGIDETNKSLVILSSSLSFFEKINPFESQQKTFEKAQKQMKADAMLNERYNERMKQLAKDREAYEKEHKPKKGNDGTTDSILANIEKAKAVFASVDKEYGKYEKGTTEKTGQIKTAYEQLSEKINNLIGKQQDLALANKDISGITAQIAALEKQKEAIDEVIRASAVAAQFGSRGENGKEYAPVAMGSEAPGKALAKTEDKKLGLVIDPAYVKEQKSALENVYSELAKSEEAFLAKHQAIQGALEGGFMAIGQSIVDSMGFAKEGLGGFVSMMFETATKLISMMLAESVAAAIKGSSIAASLLGPAGLFAQPAFIATAVGGVMAAFAAIPKFAQGGIAYGPTLGMFGEYPGASSNPEVVAPLNRLRDMLQPGGGTTVIMPAGVEIDGYKLRVLLKRVDKSLNARG